MYCIFLCSEFIAFRNNNPGDICYLVELHELDETLRPRLEQPVKEKPLIAVAIAAAGGVVLGGLTVLTLLAGGHRSE